MATSATTFEDIISCSLCLETFNHTERVPKVLPCAHNFCLECLQKFVKDKVFALLPCPLCKTVFTVPKDGVSRIPTNIMATQLLDHIATSTRSSEKVTTASCKVHGKDGCEFICLTCQVLLCKDCMKNVTKGMHALHDLDDIADAEVKLRSELQSMQVEIKSLDVLLGSRMVELREEIAKNRDDISAVVVKRVNSVIVQALDWKEKTLRNITKAAQAAENRLQDENTILLKLQHEARKILESAEKSLVVHDIVTTKKDISMVKKTLETCKSYIPTKQCADIGKITDQRDIIFGSFESELEFKSEFDVKHEDDEPLVKKRKKNPPTDEELKDAIKQILDGADLHAITMKDICLQVYANYPEFNLVPRKAFIKATVKDIIN